MQHSQSEMSVLNGVALVTGGTRGIGKAIAGALAASGMRVGLTGRTERAAQEAAKSLSSTGTVIGLPMEVTDPESVENAFAMAEAELGPVDVCVNNAGLLIHEEVPWNTDADDWWRVMEVNVKGVFLCMSAAMRRMQPRGSGRIINMASDTAIKPFPNLSAYATSKAALLRLTDSFAEAAHQSGITIVAISPGMVKTDMTAVLPVAKHFANSDWTPADKVAQMCLEIAAGKADGLWGRYLHVNYDSLDFCAANAASIQREDSHALRLRQR
jgi:NAD(P)-dependent dehydrogenase (short-subunit alcohol dehydrogenase family)